MVIFRQGFTYNSVGLKFGIPGQLAPRVSRILGVVGYILKSIQITRKLTFLQINIHPKIKKNFPATFNRWPLDHI